MISAASRPVVVATQSCNQARISGTVVGALAGVVDIELERRLSWRGTSGSDRGGRGFATIGSGHRRGYIDGDRWIATFSRIYSIPVRNRGVR
ncbi:hypothetical protein CVA01_08310 [Corynebacterium variabile]|uniref:Uncharacterized protein n=1 Tax=Corynebacterium variabile TaxID=1727 RepID=A0A4Y4C2Z0_9CORY|nr:hypothetical protein CVA01_08310 [Corynebacterium variabile]